MGHCKPNLSTQQVKQLVANSKLAIKASFSELGFCSFPKSPIHRALPKPEAFSGVFSPTSGFPDLGCRKSIDLDLFQ
ncbi:hypothetical protein ACFX13_033843 [Malus domestica]